MSTSWLESRTKLRGQALIEAINDCRIIKISGRITDRPGEIIKIDGQFRKITYMFYLPTNVNETHVMPIDLGVLEDEK